MTELFLTYNETTTGGEVVSGDENSDWPCYEDSYIEWNLEKCSLSKSRDWYYELINVPFRVITNDIVYVVYVRYGTGNTFGHTNGAWTIVGVYKTLEEANKIKEEIENNLDSDDYSKPWIGYFESFEKCEIEEMRVE